MTQLYPDDGLLFTLERLANAAGAGLIWQGFTSNTTPARGDVKSTYTLASATYFQTQVPLSSFTLEQVAAHVGTIQATNIVWTNGSGSSVTLYGYIIYEPTNNKLIAAARFDAGATVVANGGSIAIVPILGDADQST